MPAINVVANYKAIQYTGSNSAEIDAAITQFDIVSETGGVLTFESPTGSAWPTVSNGDWIGFISGAVSSVQSNTDHNNSFTRNAIYSDISGFASDITDLQAAVDALESVPALLSAGVKECPLLIVGNTTVAVDLIPALPDTSYTPNVQLFASVALLGVLSIGTVTIVDTNTVNVVVSNGGLVSVTGANVLVTITA